MITSDTQQIEQLIQALREPWAHAGTPDERMDQLRQMVLRLANDRADARELADDRLLAGNRLLKENVHYYGITKQQGEALEAQLDRIAKLERRLKTITMLVNNIDAASWVRMDAIREILNIPIEGNNEQ